MNFHRRGGHDGEESLREGGREKGGREGGREEGGEGGREGRESEEVGRVVCYAGPSFLLFGDLV